MLARMIFIIRVKKTFDERLWALDAAFIKMRYSCDMNYNSWFIAVSMLVFVSIFT